MTRSTPGPQLELRELPRQRQHREPHAARGAGPRRVALPAAGRPLQGVGEAGAAHVQRHHLARRGALLRSVDGGGAGRPEEGVGHVAGDPEPGLGQARVEAAEVHRREVVAHLRPERPQQAGAAVGRRAPADPEGDVPDPLVRARPGGARRSPRSSPARRRARAPRPATARTPRPSRRPRPRRRRGAASGRGSGGRADRSRRPRATASRRRPRSRPASPPRRRRAGRGAGRRPGARGATRRRARAPPGRSSASP